MTARVLLLHPDALEGARIAECLISSGLTVTYAPDDDVAVRQLAGSKPQLLIVYERVEGAAMEMVRRARRISPETAVVLVTPRGSLHATARAMAHGAADILAGDPTIPELQDVILRVCKAGRAGAVDVATPPPSEGPLVGESAAMLEVYKKVVRVASTRATVLILGESGTGKELVARALHELSPRKAKNCVVVDCTAIPPALLESELFGHVRGSFTGAVGDKPGLIEQAHGSTCMLDEIGELAPELQAKLLRVLQEGELRRVGAQARTSVDVRMVAATNRDLAGMVRDGTFREDLFYRLNVVTIALPPLRERVADIPALAYHFLRAAARVHDREVMGISRGALRRLCEYQWPGNVRELHNVIERAIALSANDVIGEDDLPADVLRPGVNSTRATPADVAALFSSGDSLEEMKKRYILHVVTRTRGNISRAATQLDVDRRSLYRMLHRYKLDVRRPDAALA